MDKTRLTVGRVSPNLTYTKLIVRDAIMIPPLDMSDGPRIGMTQVGSEEVRNKDEIKWDY